MDYLEALVFAKTKQHLIGRTVKGVTIDELIIRPTDPNSFQTFEQEYYNTFSAVSAITLFKEEDVEVVVVMGKKYLKEEKLVFEWKTIDCVEQNLD